jgi:hypothetical protein
MVDTEAPLSLAALSNSMALHHRQRKLTRMGEQAKTSPGKPNYSGLDLEKGISTSGRGESFFLTSLFIELIDPGV